MFEIFKEFTFEAAHHLAVNVTEGHRYSRLHGHSFQVQVFLKGEPDGKKNWVCDFAEIEQRVAELRAVLDHNYLNEITGLEVPTLENISRWIWSRLDSQLPGLNRVICAAAVAAGAACSTAAPISRHDNARPRSYPRSATSWWPELTFPASRCLLLSAPPAR